ncbi:GNAT family N-acetyltransferase [Roseovarius indicus]|uniref:GNAT family N-acetyltransferase n=1 Tax=Roseovarius indicus TaxID=540747 RepID=UPI00137480E9|nr:GNAT family N-acetyltransferase [Roseovarius indicus]
MPAYDTAPLSRAELVLETPRLILRPLADDAADLALSIRLFTDPEVVRYVCDVFPEEELAEEMPTITRRGAGGRIGIWTVTRKDTGEKIGSSILLPLPVEVDDTDWSLVVPERYPDAEIEVGYMLVPEAWGQGFATEACNRVLEFAFKKTTLDEVKATTDPGNVASQHVLTKCGLRHQGMRRAYACDCLGFSVTRAEWETQRRAC